MSTRINFYGFPQPVNGPSPSGYCQKLETFLRATGFTDYTLRTVQPISAPKGKLPYIELFKDGEKTDTIADSHFIVRELIEKGVVPDPDSRLTAAQRADTRAWQAWTEELLYPVVVYQRWCIPTNFYASRSILPGPWPLQWLFGFYLKRNITNAMWANGFGRHSDEERERLVREWAEGLEARLEGTEFFHGSEPTLIDMILCGFLQNAIGQPGNPELLKLVLGSERLKKYTAVLTRKWFPEYEGVLEVVSKRHED
ncbi:hypothetical protein P167DRAFT_483078 [Morchella conica CCBAS932]|uniref:GST C-terminal domain-containing protein n=1 Tax=Morchella conica CCBAS932 TaxID=1392247 RepID=A0A3N4KX80_9PEZI|nr:hypothetical protein P167DRAFT_483078 [Morchella conica CCBAS932]